MAAPASAYRLMAMAFAANGFHAVTMDPRGIGRSGPTPSKNVDFGVSHYLDYDVPAVVKWIRDSLPSAPLVLVGHSLGGHLASLTAGRLNEPVSSLVLLNTPFLHSQFLGEAQSSLASKYFLGARFTVSSTALLPRTLARHEPPSCSAGYS